MQRPVVAEVARGASDLHRLQDLAVEQVDALMGGNEDANILLVECAQPGTTAQIVDVPAGGIIEGLVTTRTRRLVAGKLPRSLVPFEERSLLVQGLARIPDGVRSIAGETHQLDGASNIRRANTSRTGCIDLIAVCNAMRPVVEQKVEKLPTGTIGTLGGDRRAQRCSILLYRLDRRPKLRGIIGEALDGKRGARINPAPVVVVR